MTMRLPAITSDSFGGRENEIDSFASLVAIGLYAGAAAHPTFTSSVFIE